MQIRSFLLPIMLATSVSFVACSSSDDEKETMTAEAVEPVHAEMAKDMNNEMDKDMSAEKGDLTSEHYLSYYLGYNLTSSIKASKSFTLSLEDAIAGLLAGAKGMEPSVTAEQFRAADAILRANFDAQNSTDTSTDTDMMSSKEVTPEVKQAELHLSYYITYNMATSILSSQSFNLITDSTIEGLTDGDNGIESKVSTEQIEAAYAELTAQFEAKKAALELEQSNAAKTEGLAFLEANKMKEGVMTTDSGLQYSVITKGDGTSAMPAPTDSVNVHYHGTLINGSVFDSSVDRGEPISFPLNGVIPGWTEGLQLMHIGDKFRFFIPSELAYGARSTGSIPANSVLIFDVELLNINAE